MERVPMMRGRLVQLAGVPVAQIKADEQVAWVLDGDRGITYAAKVPEGSSVVEGEWWPADYRGRPLVSLDERLREGLGLKLGDEITVNVLGRNLSATIANFRKIEWRSIGHQLRDGVLAQHLCGRAPHASRHRGAAPAASVRPRRPRSCGKPRAPIRRSRACG
jgi:hypothetical protein